MINSVKDSIINEIGNKSDIYESLFFTQKDEKYLNILFVFLDKIDYFFESIVETDSYKLIKCWIA